MTKVALLGTGKMGAAMARRMRAHGLAVRAWNRSRAKAQALEADGVEVVDSPRAASLSSRPSSWLMVASATDLLVIATLATRGILMNPLPVAVVAVLLGATVLFSLLLDLIKVQVFRRLQIV